MPDISMCKNEECDLKHKCYRYMAKPNELWQSYLDFKSIDGKCDNYWPKYRGGHDKVEE